MALPAFYKDGTVTVVNGLTTVTGVGTDFTQVQAGDELIVDAHGFTMEIASVDSAAQITLTYAYPGVSASSQTYRVRRNFSGARVVEQTRRLLQQLANGLYAQPTAYGNGTVGGDRDQYDAVDPDDYDGDVFIYWDVATDPYTIYVKLSATSGDWSAGTTIQGATGATGAAGADGAGDAYDLMFDAIGMPGSGEVLLTHIFAAVVMMPDELSGESPIRESQAVVGTNPTASAEFSVRKNGVEFATLTIGTDGSVSMAGTAQLCVPGDVLTVLAPTPRDDTLSDVSMTLAGSRS